MSDGSFTVSRADHATRAIITMGTSVATWFDAKARDTAGEVAREYADLALAMVGVRKD